MGYRHPVVDRLGIQGQGKHCRVPDRYRVEAAHGNLIAGTDIGDNLAVRCEAPCGGIVGCVLRDFVAWRVRANYAVCRNRTEISVPKSDLRHCLSRTAGARRTGASLDVEEEEEVEEEEIVIAPVVSMRNPHRASDTAAVDARSGSHRMAITIVCGGISGIQRFIHLRTVGLQRRRVGCHGDRLLR